MKVILLTDIPKVGNRYDVKDFKEGYAQNVLISKGLAILATPHELGKVADYKAKLQKGKENEIKSFKELISAIDNRTVVIKSKANEKGHLFSAIKNKDVAQAIKSEAGVDIEEDAIVFINPIKELGTHTVKIKKGDQEGECTIVVEKA